MDQKLVLVEVNVPNEGHVLQVVSESLFDCDWIKVVWEGQDPVRRWGGEGMSDGIKIINKDAMSPVRNVAFDERVREGL